MRKECIQFRVIQKDNGGTKTEKTYSYVALLCEKNGSEVKAVRLDGYASKYDKDMRQDIDRNFPGWNIKGIWKLYDSDFDE